MATQQQRLEAALARLPKVTDDVRAALTELNAVLVEAQNSPPFGAADGTIDEMTWVVARDVVNAVEQYDRTLAAGASRLRR